MVITEIQRLRRHLYKLILDGAEGPEVDVRTFDESPYRVGDTILPEQVEALVARSQYDRAHDKALYLLGLRDYACKELEKKLCADACPAVAAAVVERLREVGLLDDVAYATRMALSLATYKQYPRRRVVQELVRRGVSRELAQQAAEDNDTEDFQQALAILQKKYYNKLNDRDSRQRVMAALVRRGFSYGAIRQAMEAYDANLDAEEQEWYD